MKTLKLKILLRVFIKNLFFFQVKCYNMCEEGRGVFEAF